LVHLELLCDRLKQERSLGIQIDSNSLPAKQAIFPSFYSKMIKSKETQIIRKNSDGSFWFHVRIMTEECQNNDWRSPLKLNPKTPRAFSSIIGLEKKRSPLCYWAIDWVTDRRNC
jgi:hypothetical protein